MEILGIGAPELVFVIIIALIVLGPKDMQKAGRTIGRWLNQVVQSDGWKAFQQTSRELRNLPTNLMREANMELAETERELRKATDFRPTPSASPPSSSMVKAPEAENSIQPPEAEISIQPPAANLPEAKPEDKPDAGAGTIPESQPEEKPDAEAVNESKSDVSTTDQDA